MRNERFFAVEGLDGVGKSTVVNKLQDEGAGVLINPPQYLKKYRKYVEYKDLRARFLYYTAGVALNGIEAHRMQASQDAISDRYVLSLLATHQAMGLPEEWINKAKPLIKAINKPKKNFLLTCDKVVNMQRLLTRGTDPNDLRNLEINDAILNGYHRWADNLGYDLVEIDTTVSSPEKVVYQMKEAMG